MLRIAPDVNTLVEGTISRRGPAGALLAAWEDGQLALVLSEEVVAEYEDVLNRPRIQQRYRHLTPETIFAAATTLRQYGLFPALNEVPSVVAEDPDDDVVFAAAVSGGADYIISRDHHLLHRREHLGILILTPEAFLPILRSHLNRAIQP